MQIVMRSAFDAVHWFQDRSRMEEKRLNARRMQQLLFFAQAVHAVRHEGAAFMPAMFVATSAGPSEPNVSLILDDGVPRLTMWDPAEAAVRHLSAVWRLVMQQSAEALDAAIVGHKAFEACRSGGQDGVIGEEAMIRLAACLVPNRPDTTAGEAEEDRAPAGSALSAVPDADQEWRFTADGRSVARWKPRRTLPRASVTLRAGSPDAE